MAEPPTLDRREVVAVLLKERSDLLVVSGLGSPTYDVHSAGDVDANYYLWGAMGSAALIGFGLAQARADRTVIVITGDGEQLMGLGGLASIAIARPKNLAVIVLDNGHYGETGMQKSHTGLGLELADVAKACGFAETRVADDLGAVREIRDALHQVASGPRFYVIKVKAENLPRSLPPRDAVYLKNRFRAHLGLTVT
jgi:thiamine pyrophosphate-dependent acetolactate synthase large subunit-like protein